MGLAYFIQMILVGVVCSVPQVDDFTPSIRINERMATYPVYLKSGSIDRRNWMDSTTAQSIQQSLQSIESGNFDPVKPVVKPSKAIDIKEKEERILDTNFNLVEGLTTIFKKIGGEKQSNNASSRFFSLDTSKQNLNLGISFSIPFFTIPMASLLSFGESTTSALSGMLNVNWTSFLMTALLVGGASFLIPKLTTVLMSFLTQYGFPDNLLNKFGALTGNRANDNMPSYSEYLRSLEVMPFTSILNQIDEAMKEYDLDSTSCMQRVVCSYVADAEAADESGITDPTNLIIKGITRSSWVQGMLGDNALTEALEVGRKGESCSKTFYKCPFSLAGILRLLTKFVQLNR